MLLNETKRTAFFPLTKPDGIAPVFFLQSPVNGIYLIEHSRPVFYPALKIMYRLPEGCF